MMHTITIERKDLVAGNELHPMPNLAIQFDPEVVDLVRGNPLREDLRERLKNCQNVIADLRAEIARLEIQNKSLLHPQGYLNRL